MSILFQAEPNVTSTLKSIRDHVHHVCSQCMNRAVRVQTIDGHTYEGTVVNCDGKYLYLSVSNTQDHRAFFGPGPFYGPSPYYQNVILPLVLFELLTIALIA